MIDLEPYRPVCAAHNTPATPPESYAVRPVLDVAGSNSQTSNPPLRSEVKAMRLPSGDQAGALRRCETGTDSLPLRNDRAKRRGAMAMCGSRLCGVLVIVMAVGVAGTPRSTLAAGGSADLQAQVQTLQARLQAIEDREAVERLTRSYGYYVDKGQWDEIADLFADTGRVEIAGRGVYIGKRSVTTFFRQVLGHGKNGLAEGMLFNHLIFQGIVDVAADGRTARGRWQVFAQVGSYQHFGVWAEGIFVNQYVKENGVWKFSEMHYYATFYTPYADGWAKTALPNNGPSKEFPPDAPQSVQYDVYPGSYIPPYHYPNPVTGRPWQPEQPAGRGR